MVAAELSTLVAGISGAVVISVFSSNLPDTFVAPRTLPATAILVSEPEFPALLKRSAQSVEDQPQSCPRAVINVGSTINLKKQKISPAVNKLSNILEPFKKLVSPISNLKSRVYQKLKLDCLFPKLLRPYQPMFKYFRCKLGLSEDEFMQTPPCNVSMCLNTNITEEEITRDLGLQNLDFMIDDQVSTMDDCFSDMSKVLYGARVRAKLVDDVSCDDPRYQQICQELIEQNRMLVEESCENSRYLNSLLNY